MPTIRACAVSLALFVLSASAAFAATSDTDKKRDSDEKPENTVTFATTIQFSNELRSEVDDLLRRSPTFRAQYQRIAEAGSVVIGVHSDIRLCQTDYRARTTFRRYQSGLIVADVSIGPGSNRGEWMAHEFEHILEQLDGHDLPQLARDHAKDVWYSGSDVIETDRAIRAGRAVHDELRRSQNTQ